MLYPARLMLSVLDIVLGFVYDVESWRRYMFGAFRSGIEIGSHIYTLDKQENCR